MYRGTTPTLRFHLPFPVRTFAVVYVTFKQGGVIRIEKSLEDMSIEGEEENQMVCTLTQEETLGFSSGYNIEMQIRARTQDGVALASKIMTVPVSEIIKGGVI